MATFILFLALLVGGASIVFYAAGDMAGHGSRWAADVCSAARLFCDSPHLVSFAAVGLGGLWIVVRIVSALRG